MTTIAITSASPPHLIVLRMRGCGRMGEGYTKNGQACGAAAPHSGQGADGARPVRGVGAGGARAEFRAAGGEEVQAPGEGGGEGDEEHEHPKRDREAGASESRRVLRLPLRALLVVTNGPAVCPSIAPNRLGVEEFNATGGDHHRHRLFARVADDPLCREPPARGDRDGNDQPAPLDRLADAWARSHGGRVHEKASGLWRVGAALGAGGGWSEAGAGVGAGGARAEFRAAGGEGVETPGEGGGEGGYQHGDPNGAGDVHSARA